MNIYNEENCPLRIQNNVKFAIFLFAITLCFDLLLHPSSVPPLHEKNGHLGKGTRKSGGSHHRKEGANDGDVEKIRWKASETLIEERSIVWSRGVDQGTRAGRRHLSCGCGGEGAIGGEEDERGMVAKETPLLEDDAQRQSR
jgi:hypothetical protein